MKISHVHIKDHQQFKDFKLDLTYPKGHEKEGQPLDKVCFIGQSGTGKTTLLESLMLLSPPLRLTTTIPFNKKEIIYKDKYNRDIIFNNNNIIKSDAGYSLNRFIKNHYPVYFPILSNKKLIDYGGFIHQKINGHGFIISLFNTNTYKKTWSPIKSKIQKHQNQVIKYNNAIARAAIKKDELSMNKYIKQLKTWEDENETPLLDLADNYLDKILNDFHLKVKTELESLEEIDSIHLVNTETLETIPEEYWSSGIKNIIARTLPLYIHNFKERLICIDEPENSLYPDIQRKMIDIYTSLTTDCQFFFATHSPIIASSFEPWEIVELKFNDEGYVYREEYWEGENHVDNYKYDPRYLRWDSILTQIFDLEEDGGAERKQMLSDFAKLDNDLKARKKAGEQLDKHHKDVQRLMKMGQLLGWNTK